MTPNDDAVSIELIKKTFTSKHFPDLFAGKSTHNAALALVAQLVPFTDDEELIFKIVRSGLPENYDGDMLDEISSMVHGAIKNGFGDGNPIGPPDPSELMASQVVKLAMAKATDFFHDRNRRSYVSMLTDQGGVRTISLNSSAASEWLAALWYATARGALPSNSKADALATLQAHALFDGQQHPISHRVARTADAIYVDLGGSSASSTPV